MAEKKAGALLESGPPPGYDETAASSSSVFQTTFACMSLHASDKIRLLRFPNEDITKVQNTITRTWKQGIQDKRMYDEAYEFKLYGRPWNSRTWGGDQPIEPRQLMCALLAELFDIGWILKSAVDVSKKEYDKDSLMFRRQTPPPPPCNWLCISFDRGDLMRIINGPPELAAALAQAYGKRVQQQHNEQSTSVIKFRGYPWRPSGTDTVQTRVLILILMETLEKHGYSVYAAIDQDNGPGSDSASSGADTLFCNRQTDWVPGAPIYHG